MEIKTFSPLDQVEPAVDLGVLPRALPEILNLRQLVETAPAMQHDPNRPEDVLKETTRRTA